MTWMDAKTGLRFAGPLALCALMGSVYCALSGAIAHLAAASASQDLYSIAIGDHVLPTSPIDSWLWGPILIGTYVTWWIGLIAAPAFFIVTFMGGRPVPNWKVMLQAGIFGWLPGSLTFGALVALAARRAPPAPGEWGVVLAVTVIQWGYWALVTALLGMAAFLAMWRRRNLYTVKEA